MALIFPRWFFILKIFYISILQRRAFIWSSEIHWAWPQFLFLLLNSSKIKCSTLNIFQMHAYLDRKAYFGLFKDEVPTQLNTPGKLKWDSSNLMKISWARLCTPLPRPLRQPLWCGLVGRLMKMWFPRTAPRVCLVHSWSSGFHCSVGGAGNGSWGLLGSTKGRLGQCWGGAEICWCGFYSFQEFRNAER